MAAAVPGEHFENCTTAVCCFFGVGAAERAVGGGGLRGASSPDRQEWVGGLSQAFFFLVSIPQMYSQHVAACEIEDKYNSP